MKGKLALVAGEGRLPLQILAGLRQRGDDDPVVFLLGNDIRPWQEAECAFRIVKNPLAFGVLFASMRLMGVHRLMMAGRVPKRLMYAREKMDSSSRRVVDEASDRNDHSLLGSVVRTIERFGIHVVGYDDVVPEMLAKPGYMAGPEPSDSDRADLDYGWPILRRLLPMSFGQSIVVAGRSVVAVEAMEGTDAMIDRAGNLVGRGVLLKALRADQDRRFDLPVVGCITLEHMAAVGLSSLFVEAGSVLIIDGESFSRAADRLKIAVEGVEPCRYS